jgi:hypothetical protein
MHERDELDHDLLDPTPSSDAWRAWVASDQKFMERWNWLLSEIPPELMAGYSRCSLPEVKWKKLHTHPDDGSNE